jgi:argininosuccinate lyase
MKKPWGGRFGGETDKKVEEFTASIGFDRELSAYDIAGSIAHARTLERAGVLTADEADRLEQTLTEIGAEIAGGAFTFRDDLEDVHMNIEAALKERLGDLGGKLHTGRSRNDQVSVDTRLFVKDRAGRVADELKRLRRVILDRAKQHIGAVMPGYTHLQPAQPVLLSHWLLAYWEMFHRDGVRFRAALSAADLSPLGSGALAGVPYPLDRDYTAGLLGLSGTTANSMDAVSNRDFVLDFLFAAAVTMMHLSRLSEELVIFSSTEFGYIILPDGYATGSSIMPQKKNPDTAELVRGKSGRVYGDLISLLVTMKGLPMTYNRDLQEDKEPLFDAARTVVDSLSVTAGMLAEITFNTDRMEKALSGGFITATDCADYLVGKGMSFREAHETVGRMVAYLEKEAKGFGDLGPETFKEFSELFDRDIARKLTVDASVRARSVFGGTAPDRVAEMIERAISIEEGEISYNR